MKTRKASVLITTFIVCLVLVIIVSTVFTLVIHYNLNLNIRIKGLREEVFNTIIRR